VYKSGLTPLCQAIMSRSEDLIRILMEQGQVNPMQPCRLKKQAAVLPLELAVSRGEEIVALLLGRKLDVNQPAGSKNAVVRAAKRGHEDCLQLLVSKGKPSAAVISQAMAAAKAAGRADCVKILSNKK